MKGSGVFQNRGGTLIPHSSGFGGRQYRDSSIPFRLLSRILSRNHKAMASKRLAITRTMTPIMKRCTLELMGEYEKLIPTFPVELVSVRRGVPSAKSKAIRIAIVMLKKNNNLPLILPSTSRIEHLSRSEEHTSELQSRRDLV